MQWSESNINRSIALVICQTDVGVVVQQQLAASNVRCESRTEQRRVAVFATAVHVGIGFYQELRNLHTLTDERE